MWRRRGPPLCTVFSWRGSEVGVEHGAVAINHRIPLIVITEDQDL
jgi:hypothetical protein